MAKNKKKNKNNIIDRTYACNNVTGRKRNNTDTSTAPDDRYVPVSYGQTDCMEVQAR